MKKNVSICLNIHCPRRRYRCSAMTSQVRAPYISSWSCTCVLHFCLWTEDWCGFVGGGMMAAARRYCNRFVIFLPVEQPQTWIIMCRGNEMVACRKWRHKVLSLPSFETEIRNCILMSEICIALETDFLSVIASDAWTFICHNVPGWLLHVGTDRRFLLFVIRHEPLI